MTKSRYSWLAVALALSGAAIMTGHPDWGLVTGGAILILAGAVALGAMRTETERRDEESKIAGQKVSNILVTASAAAIIAVYAAGFQRTRAAADEFEARVARRKAAVISTAAVVVPESQPATEEAPPPVVFPTGSGAVLPSQPSSKRAADSASANSSSAKAGTNAEPRSAAASKSNSASACWPNKPPEACVQPSAGAAATTSPTHYKDGTYSGTGTSHHGNIEASLAIQGGQIASTTIATCTTRFTCSVVDPLSKEVIGRQNAKLDFISGATESSDAFAEAVGAALAQAGAQIHYKDGTYSAWGTSRHGNLEVSVVVEKGQIASAAIAGCATNYPCSVVNPLLKQAVARQGPNVDFLTGATDSSDAFAEALLAALAQAHE